MLYNLFRPLEMSTIIILNSETDLLYEISGLLLALFTRANKLKRAHSGHTLSHLVSRPWSSVFPEVYSFLLAGKLYIMLMESI